MRQDEDSKPRRLLCGAFVALCAVACGGSPQSGDGNGGGGNSGSGAVGGSGAQGGGGGQAGGGGGGFDCTEGADPGPMVQVPGGEFIMGCNDAVDSMCDADEKPMRNVNLAGFEIDTFEVTQKEYISCVNAGACNPPECGWNCANADLPATCVNWQDAADFCAWAGKRLPTEAEWEKAARGSDGRKYPWGNDDPTCDLVNMEGCAGALEPVGMHPNGASPYGAMDMAGNMVELVADYYSADYYSVAPNNNPPGPSSGSTYVGRGGGFKSAPEWQRTSKRDWYDPPDQGQSLGFRCAK